MGKKSLLTKEDIDILESWADGYFYKIFYYLEDFVKKGIEQKLFTKCERKAPKFIYGDISSLKNNDSISLFFIVLYF